MGSEMCIRDRQCAELAAHVEQKAKIRDLSEEDNNRLIDMVERVVADLKK